MSTENLKGKEALDKLKSLSEEARICMMVTALDKRPPSARPMTIQSVDDKGIMWFISSKESDKNHELRKDSELNLYFMNNGDAEYLSVYGEAEIYGDQKTINEHYSKLANAWFDGKDDPDVTIIGVKPKNIKYWDTKHGKLVDMALMLYSAVSGDQSVDGGLEGNLEI